MLQLASLLDEPVEVIIRFKAKSLFQVISLKKRCCNANHFGVKNSYFCQTFKTQTSLATQIHTTVYI